MQLFAAQTRPGRQTTHSLRGGQSRRSKRKRDEDDPDDEHDKEDPSLSLDTPTAISSHSAEADQLRIAGLLPENAPEIPPKPFPHASARTATHPTNSAKLQKSLDELDFPLFGVNATSSGLLVGGVSETPASRQAHLGVLSAVMHRWLLEGDFQRAGKAWGLILRTHIAGVPIDPRNHGRWGIGAEILLHRSPRPTHNRLEGNANAEPPVGDDSFSEEGFELAREYYERLIVQHPHRKHIANAIDELTFYPAMFSLWIYEVLEKSKRMRKSFEDGDQSMTDDMVVGLEERHAHRSAIITDELQHARQIAARLDQLVISPPFDKSGELLQLRGMVALWIGDLILKKDTKRTGDWDNASISEEDLSMESNETSPERLQRLLECRREYRQAMDSFARAQANGKRLWDVQASTEARIKELSRKIETLEAG